MNLTEKEQKKKKKKGIFPKCVWGEGELKDKDRLDLEMRRGGRENAWKWRVGEVESNYSET